MPNRFRLENFPDFSGEIAAAMGADFVLNLYPVGSYETVNGIGFRDIDILCYCLDTQGLHRFLVQGDWVLTENNGYQGEFRSYRANFDNFEFNLLVTDNPNFKDRFLKAATLCKHLQLTDKEQRILVHNMFINQQLPRNIWEIE